MVPFSRFFAWRRLGWTVLLLAAVLGTFCAAAAVRSTGGVLNKAARWETPYYVQQSDRAGPTVILVGGIHGDEPAGAVAAEQIRRWPITRGTLAVLPRANPPGLAAHTRNMPEVGKELANLNRNFPKAKQQPSPAAGEPAIAIWAWVQSLHPAWLVDLHEGGGVRAEGSKSVGSSVIVFPSVEADAAAKEMLQAVNAGIEEPGKRFVRLRMPIDGSLARAAGEHLHAQAMILETSIRVTPAPVAKTEPQPKVKTGKSPQPKSESSTTPQPLSKRVRQHRLMVGALLKHLGMIDPALDVDQVSGRPVVDHSAQPPEKTWVAMYDAGGVGGRGPACIDRILGDAGMEVVRVGPEEIVAGALSQFDLVIFPGGSGSREAAAIGKTGREQVRRFVEGGGGCVGICAGAYLCTSGFDWSLKILNAKTVSPLWRRGTGTVQMELTPEGRRILGDRTGRLDVHYAAGPIVSRAAQASLPDYEVLAFFRSELAKNGTPAGIMIDSPAIAMARFGKGRVMSISPHPEQTPALEDLFLRAAQWAAGKK